MMLKTYEAPVLTKAGSVESKTEAMSNVTGAMSAANITVTEEGTTKVIFAFS